MTMKTSWLFLWLSITATAVANDNIVGLTLYPRVVQQGQGVRLTCRVPRDARNRMVAFGFTDWTATERQVNGLDARVTWEHLYEHIPCDASEGFCAVSRADRSPQRVVLPLIITGCEP